MKHCFASITTGMMLFLSQPLSAAPGLLTPLKQGMSVLVEEQTTGYIITLKKGEMIGNYDIEEVGDSFVSLKDKSNFMEIRIPVTSIRSIKILKK